MNNLGSIKYGVNVQKRIKESCNALEHELFIAAMAYDGVAVSDWPMNDDELEKHIQNISLYDTENDVIKTEAQKFKTLRDKLYQQRLSRELHFNGNPTKIIRK